MEVLENDLRDRYRRLDTDELVELYRTKDLTKTAELVLLEELSSRGAKPKENRAQVEDNNKIIIENQRTEVALQTIKHTAVTLYVISCLQIVISLSFQFYIGVFFGIVIGALAFRLRYFKEPTAGVAIAALGGIASVLNIIGPLLSELVWGNLILSIFTIWLGIRGSKAVTAWNKSRMNIQPDNDVRL